MIDWLTCAYSSFPLLAWTLGSILAYAVSTNLWWLFRAGRWPQSPYGRGLEHVARFLFFVGIPYLALGGWPREPFQGLLSLEDMGLVGLSARWPATRWLSAAGTALGLGLVACLLLVLAWANAQRSAADSRLRFLPRPWWTVLVEILYLEVHWAFYRGALALASGDGYAAVFLGLGLVYLEWGLNPFWRWGWRSAAESTEQWLRAAVALVVALIFLLTCNWWLCLAVHLLLELVFRRLLPALAVVPAG